MSSIGNNPSFMDPNFFNPPTAKEISSESTNSPPSSKKPSRSRVPNISNPNIPNPIQQPSSSSASTSATSFSIENENKSTENTQATAKKKTSLFEKAKKKAKKIGRSFDVGSKEKFDGLPSLSNFNPSSDKNGFDLPSFHLTEMINASKETGEEIEEAVVTAAKATTGAIVGMLAEPISATDLYPWDGKTYEEAFSEVYKGQLDQMPPNAEAMRQHTLQKLDVRDVQRPPPITIKLETPDNCQLDTVWAPATNISERPSVVLYHGNMCTLDSMADKATFYAKHDFNVIMCTIRGYPGSTGSARTDKEKGCINDALTPVVFLLQQGVDHEKILVDGFSIGGNYAAVARDAFNTHATLDHTFDGLQPLVQDKRPNLSPESIQSAIKRNFPANKEIKQTDLPAAYQEVDLPSMKTNGYNSAERIASSDKPIFVFHGGDSDEVISEGCAQRLIDCMEKDVDHTGKEEAEELNERDNVAILLNGHVMFKPLTGEIESEYREQFGKNYGPVVHGLHETAEKKYEIWLGDNNFIAKPVDYDSDDDW